MHYHTFKTIRLLGLAVLLSVGLYGTGWAQQKAFKLHADPANTRAQDIEESIMEIKEGINSSDRWKGRNLSGDHPAVGILSQLVDQNGITNLRIPTNGYLIKNEDNTYQVRNLYVKTADTKELEHQQLVLQFNDKAQLIGTSLAPDIFNYQQILDRAARPNSNAKEHVKDLVDQFQQALSTNELQTVKSFLSKESLIIEGRIARYFHDNKYGPYYDYQALSPEQYLQSLQKDDNSSAVQHKQLNVYKHTFNDKIYVATFNQTWQNDSYQDTGYVAMVVDLNDKQPIRLRHWQDHPYETGQLKQKIRWNTEISSTPFVSTLGKVSDLEVLTGPIRHQHKEKNNTHWRPSKKQWLMVAGTTAIISAGIAILSGREDSGLPDPPGRPAMK